MNIVQFTRFNRRIFLFVLLLTLSGCESLAYYSQAAKGQWQILWQQQDNISLIEANADSELSARLQTIERVRVFAAEELDLPVGDAYGAYVDVGREYVVWNVFAAPTLSVEPKQWCFPIAGCVSYRGYFSEIAARNKAAQLSAQGLDVFVGGVSAYSTLGWFDDPVLNTFLKRDDPGLAALLFHEIAHRQLYIPGDTAFNESFATAIEYEALWRWLDHAGGGAKARDYIQRKRDSQDLIAVLLEVRSALADVYASDLVESEKLAKKTELLGSIETRFEVLNINGRYERFRPWVTQGYNNARLATIADYHQWVPAFIALIKQAPDWKHFYHDAAELAKLDKVSRDKVLRDLLKAH